MSKKCVGSLFALAFVMIFAAFSSFALSMPDSQEVKRGYVSGVVTGQAQFGGEYQTLVVLDTGEEVLLPDEDTYHTYGAGDPVVMEIEYYYHDGEITETIYKAVGPLSS